MPWHKLQTFLHNHTPLALAFSGGLDSRFLAYAAKQAGCEILLLHANGLHISRPESDYAKLWAKQQKIPLKSINVDILSLEQVQHNHVKRCYFCKKYLFSIFKDVALAKGLTLCDGTNADDLQSHRPGLQALKELNVISPLANCGICKGDIRQIGAKYGFDNTEQKPSPCLLTRFNYGLHITPSLLNRVSLAENELAKAGLQDFRLRLCPEPILQSKVQNISQDIIIKILEKHGFIQPTVHITEHISGFFDK